jgi:acyl-CoA synthetase (AMP-forming)/AMP-acid ligase II
MDASPNTRVELRIGDLLRRNAQAVPERPAASLGDAVLTHAGLDLAASRIASALRERGAVRGERVLAFADTSLETLALFAACSKAGLVFAPLDARLSEGEARVLAEVARPHWIVADASCLDAAAAAARAVGAKPAVLGRLAGAAPPDALLAARAPSEAPDDTALRETDPHVMFFTSGSTGRPKAVVLSHRASYLRTFQGVFRDEPEISVCMFPLFHMAGFTLALSAWQTRGELALVPQPTAEALLEATSRRRGTRMYGIPAVWHRILAADLSRYDLSSLRELDTGTSATPIELIQALKARFPGTVTRIYYGSTEVGSAANLPDADVLRKPGSVGLASPGVDLRLGDDGEIQVRSAYLMDGYFEDPRATAEALRGGWFHTGDLGELDAEGYLHVTGRKKDVIRTGGESVTPGEVEAALARHPGVAEVAVVGVPDLQWGEVVCAVVVPSGSAPTLADLQRHCEGQLAPFKRPRRLELVTALPRTAATGQVQRALLVQRLVAPAPGRA